MEHLPPVNDPALPLLQVPYLCEDLPYDSGDVAAFPFVEYPTRRGMNMDQLRERINGTLETDEQTWTSLCRFLQSWLYAGVVHICFHTFLVPWNHHIFENVFVRMDAEGRRLITTEKLPSLMDAWIWWYKTGPPGELASQAALLRNVVRNQIQNALRQVLYTVNVGSADVLAPIDWMPQQTQDVLLSIIILSQSLLSMLSQGLDDVEGYRIGMPYILGSSLITQRLLQAKWCRSWIKGLSTHLGPLEMVYAGQLRRPATRQDHSRCSFDQCLHEIVDESRYKNRHYRDCRGCYMLTVREEDIVACFNGESYPLIRLVITKDRSGNNTFKLRTVRSASGLPYVAFSHVWSDGLGHPYCNALPICQVLRLTRTLLQLATQPFAPAEWDALSPEQRALIERWRRLTSVEEPAVLFWIDTLCVPSQKQHKQMALAKLHETFSNADQVVVLDDELQQSSWQTPILENLMRIRMSKWMTRLWTLEEASLTKEGSLCFLFEDGMFPLHESWEHTKRDADRQDVVQQYMQTTTFRAFGRILKLKKLPRFEKITELGHLMISRSTTKEADECLVIATMLKLDSSILFMVPVRCRTKVLLHQVRFWPFHIMFNNMLERMTEPGYRWAPRSFLGKGISAAMLGTDVRLEENLVGKQIPHSYIDSTALHFASDGGLFIRLRGFRFKTDLLPIGLKYSDTRNVLVMYDLPSKAWYSCLYRADVGRQPWSDMRRRASDRAGLFAMVVPGELVPGGNCTAVLLSIYGGEVGNTLHAEWLCTVDLFRHSELGFLSQLVGREGAVPVVDGEILPASRKLCEQILEDMWTGRDPLRQTTQSSDDKKHEMRETVKDVEKSLCAMVRTKDDQYWCIG